ncbi:MAG: bacterioferritin [Nitrospirales bacterium]|nr:MAG: bacterioferritin [Nitrospirales bacterium]
MKGKKGVVDLLNKILTEELTVINQYFLHARMCENWGFERLEQKVKERSFGEMKDADEIIRHILFLEGLPNVQRLGKVTIGETVPEQLKLDLQKEKDMVKLLTESIEHCVKVGDYNTRQKLEDMVKDEEEHIDWIETQLETIKQVGLENYLSEQMHKEG